VRVGHRQASIFETPVAFRRQGFLLFGVSFEPGAGLSIALPRRRTAA
jgi:hypothetical protein